MFLRRIVENLKSQNWTAIGLDLGIVMIGVFIGTQVSNWNQERLEKRETEQLLLELRPELQSFTDFSNTARPYYATTRAYSDKAFAGWKGDPAVSDEQFVIAAYQASQIYTRPASGEIWTEAFGGNRLRDIGDTDVRRALSNIMTFNYDQFEQAIMTPYRQDVRSVIPVDIQDAIRAECGDRLDPARPQLQVLPASCDLEMPDARLAEAAAALRSNPQLVSELRWHTAAVAAFLTNLDVVDVLTRDLQKAIDESVK